MLDGSIAELGDLDGTSGVVFITQTFDYSASAFPATGLVLPRWPVQSVTSISYVDGNGDPQTIAPEGYEVDPTSKPTVVTPISGTWTGAVTVRFVAGYGDDADDVPENV